MILELCVAFVLGLLFGIVITIFAFARGLD